MADDAQPGQVAAAGEPALTRMIANSWPHRSQKLSVAATGEPQSGHVPAEAADITSESEV